MRGGVCVGIPQVWGDCFVLAKCLPLLCEVVFVVALCLTSKCRGCVCKERSCVLPVVVAPNSRWRFPVWESCVDKWIENPSVWRRGRRAVCSNLETYPCVSDWPIDSLTLSLSLYYFVSCIISYCSFIYYMLGLFVCASLVFITTRASYSTSTLIQRNQEELVQSPSPGIRLHSLVALSVVAN